MKSKTLNFLSIRSFCSHNKKKLVSNTNEVKLNSYPVEPSNLNIKKSLVFLHGLFGNSNNWRGISYAEAIRSKRRSILIDLRNHGESDHHPEMFYPAMADDVIRHLDSLNIQKFTLLGHSMGAKIAMNIAVKIPSRLDGLIIVDSAPKDHKNDKHIISSTKETVMKVSHYDIENKSRKVILEDLKKMLNSGVANLMNTNLVYKSDGTDHVEWKCNIKAIKENIDKIIGFESPHGLTYEKPMKVLVGEKSYIFKPEVYKTLFPKIKQDDIVVIKGAGHWVHADQPLQVINQVSQFLEEIDHRHL
jgi:pimeloyl-ACP methyl ester carboxylesterase